jgi:hypothetical protein
MRFVLSLLTATSLALCLAPGIATAGVPLPDPIHYWNFDEGAGNLAQDSIGSRGLNKRSGPAHAWVTGFFGVDKALDFQPRSAGSTAFEMKPSPLVRSAPWSAAFWVQRNADPTADSTGFRQLFIPATDTTNFRLQLESMLHPSKVKTRLPGIMKRTPKTVHAFGGGTPLAQGDWAHVVMVATGTDVTLYTNGAPNGAPIAENVTLDIKYLFSSAITIDELRIYDRVLTAAEVGELHRRYIERDTWLVLKHAGVEVDTRKTLRLEPGPTDVGGSRTYSVRLESRGLLGVTLSGSPRIECKSCNAGEFAIGKQPASSVLQPGQATDFDIVFTPKDGGIRTAVLRIVTDIPGVPAIEFTIEAEGKRATPSRLVLVGALGSIVHNGSLSLSRTSTQVGGVQVFPLTLRNDGPGTVRLTGFTRVRCDCGTGDFAVTSQPGASVLAPGATTTLQVTFTPRAQGTRSGTLLVDTDIPGIPTARFGINAPAVAPPPPPPPPPPVGELRTVNDGGTTYTFLIEYWPAPYDLPKEQRAGYMTGTPRYVTDRDPYVRQRSGEEAFIVRVTNKGPTMPSVRARMAPPPTHGCLLLGQWVSPSGPWQPGQQTVHRLQYSRSGICSQPAKRRGSNPINLQMTERQPGPFFFGLILL